MAHLVDLDEPAVVALPGADQLDHSLRALKRRAYQLFAGYRQEGVVSAAVGTALGLGVTAVVTAESFDEVDHRLSPVAAGLVKHVDADGHFHQHRAKEQREEIDAGRRLREPVLEEPGHAPGYPVGQSVQHRQPA